MIGVLQNRILATGALVSCLRKQAQPENIAIFPVGDASAVKDVFCNPRIQKIFLPGIVGEVSPYSALFDQSARAAAHDFVARGGNMIGLCAGAYFFGHDCVYRGQYKQQRGLGFFNILAHGPLENHFEKLARLHAQNETGPLSDVLLADVVLADGRQGKVPYAAGPYYHEDQSGAAENIFARFKQPEGAVALADKRYGDGRIVFCGTLPYFDFATSPHPVLAGMNADVNRALWEFVLHGSPSSGERSFVCQRRPQSP